MYFWGFVDDSGCGGVWGEGVDCLVEFGGEVWVFLYFCHGFPCFGLWLPLGIVHFEFSGELQGLEGNGVGWTLA